MFDHEIQGLKQIYVKIRTGLPPLKGMLKGHITYRDQHTDSIGVSSNRQTHQIVSYLGTQSQWLTAVTNASQTNRDSLSYAAWIGLSPITGYAASTNVTANTAPNNDKMGMSYATVYSDILNRTTSTCYVKMSYYCAKQDTDEDCLECYQQNVNNSALYNSTFALGGASALPTTSGNEVVNYAIATTTNNAFMTTLPYTNLQSKSNVKTTWKLMKVKSLTLAAADTVKVTTNIESNQFCIKERMQNASAVYPRGCIAIVFSVQGGATVDLVTQQGVLAAPSLSIVTTRKVQLCPLKIPNSRFDTTFVGAGSVPTGNTTINTEQISQAMNNAANVIT